MTESTDKSTSGIELLESIEETAYQLENEAERRGEESHASNYRNIWKSVQKARMQLEDDDDRQVEPDTDRDAESGGKHE